MSIEQLEKRARQLSREARDKINQVKDDTPEAEARSIEREFDALIAAHDDVRAEIEELRDAGDPRRPINDSAPRNGQDSDSLALRNTDSFAQWAEARSSNEHRDLSLGKYLRALVNGAKTDGEKRALSEGSDSAGGYTVPTVLSGRLIDLLRANSVVNQAGAQTVPLTSDNKNIAALASDPSPAWRDEAASVAESDPTFRNVQLVPRSLAVLTKVSFELMQDSLNLEAELPRIMATALAKELDRVALLGTGTAPEPRGIANQSGIGTSALSGALTNYAPLVSARTAILSANAGPVTAIIMSPRDEGTYTGLTATDNQPLMAPGAIADIPKLTTTAIPIDGGAGSDESTIFAGNFRHLLIGMRSDIRVEVLRERYADTMQYGLLCHLRADVAVQHAGAFYTVTGVQG